MILSVKYRGELDGWPFGDEPLTVETSYGPAQLVIQSIGGTANGELCDKRYEVIALRLDLTTPPVEVRT